MISVATRHRTGSAVYESDAARWAAVAGRDPRADGVFYYSVRTTGVYCRPSCAARLARRENVRFHATCGDAARAGFRPCKRCRPDGHGLEAARAEAVARACRLIEAAEEAPSLDALAAAAPEFESKDRSAGGLAMAEDEDTKRRHHGERGDETSKRFPGVLQRPRAVDGRRPTRPAR